MWPRHTWSTFIVMLAMATQLHTASGKSTNRIRGATGMAGYATVTLPVQAAVITSLPVTISAAAEEPPQPTRSTAPAADTFASYGEKLKGQAQPNSTYELPPLPPAEPTPSDGSYALPAVYAHPTAVQHPSSPVAAAKQQQQQQVQPAAAFVNSSRPATTLSVVSVTTSQPVTVKISPARQAGVAPSTEVNVAGRTRKVVGGDRVSASEAAGAAAGQHGRAGQDPGGKDGQGGEPAQPG